MAIFKGWNASILKDGVVIGSAESASVEVSTGVEPYYGIGSRTPETLVPGNQEVTGSISKAWVNLDYLNLVTGSQSLTHFDLVFKADPTGPWIYCYGCLFETGTVDIPQDGFLTEDYDFRATSVGTKMGS